MIVREAERARDAGKYPTLLCAPRGRPFPREGEALLYPGFRIVRIKGITRLANERYLVAVKGAPRSAVDATRVLIAGGSGVYRGRVGYGIASVRIPPGRYRLRGGLFFGCELPGSVRVRSAGRGYRIDASDELPLVPGGRYQLHPLEPGSHSFGDLVLVLPGEVAGAARERLLHELGELPFDVDRLRIYRIVLSSLGWIVLPASFEGRRALGGVELPGSIVISEGELAHLSSRVPRIVRAFGGATPLEVSREIQLAEELIASVAAELVRAGVLRLSKGVLLPPNGELPLSPYERRSVEALREAALKGRRVASVHTQAERALFAKLRRLQLVEEIAGSYVAREAVDEAEQRLLGRGDSVLTLEEARELLGSGSPQALFLLERLERGGKLSRMGEGWQPAKGREGKL